MPKPKIPVQRWQIAKPDIELSEKLSSVSGLSPLLTQVLLHRGIDTPSKVNQFLNPAQEILPSPLTTFTDLEIALKILADAIAQRHLIAICGDYDADGMTSTALLIRALRQLGARVDYAIPSRMSEGYGINERIVDDFHAAGVQVLVTVDNGIAAFEPIAHARQLGLSVIVTDHHDIPPQLPPANAILNPKRIDATSPYRGLAGVGVAYLLALSLAEALGSEEDLSAILLELFTLGTIADLAPLTGVNRRWVQRGLACLPQSKIEGVRALLHVSGLSEETNTLKPEAIGFRLGPRINAVGRIGDPAVVIELLTTDDPGHALEMAMKCEQINQQRRQLCETIEQEAIATIEATQPDIMKERVLVVVQPGWHHGVIGIVASRLVERYGAPVFIGTYEDDEGKLIRGSARSIPEFNIFSALQFCGDILEKFGGHHAAGGFSLKAEQLPDFRLRLHVFANMYLLPHHLRPLVRVDVQASLSDLTMDLLRQIDQLHPCGVDNPDPVFWTPNVRVIEQGTVGRDRNHLKCVFSQDLPPSKSLSTSNAVANQPGLKGIAWRLGEFCPIPNRVDIAFRLRLNEWNGSTSVELEVIGIRAPSKIEAHSTSVGPVGHRQSPGDECSETFNLQGLWTTSPVSFQYRDRPYWASLCCHHDDRELRIRNADGNVFAIQPSMNRGLMGQNRDSAQEVNLFEPYYFDLICAAVDAVRSVQTNPSTQTKPKDSYHALGVSS